MKKKKLEDLLPFEFKTDGDILQDLLSLWSDKSYLYKVYNQTFNFLGDMLVTMIALNETLADILIPPVFKELDKRAASDFIKIDNGSNHESLESEAALAAKAMEWSERYAEAWNEMDLETCQFYALSVLRFQKDAAAASFDLAFDVLAKAKHASLESDVHYQAKDIKKFD